MDNSVDFDDTNSPRSADHDDIDFDINTPRDDSSVDLSNDIQISVEQHSEIPSIVITEPSSANLVDLADDCAKEKQVEDEVTKEKHAISGDNVQNSEGGPDKVSSPSNQQKSNDIDLEFVPDEVIESQNKELHDSENGREEVNENISTEVKQDAEIEVNVVAGNSSATGGAKTEAGSAPTEMVKGKEAPGNYPEIQMSELADIHDEVTNEIQVDETVSLDNIFMKDKTESDSDDEFDFDLPAGPTAGPTPQPPPAQSVAPAPAQPVTPAPAQPVTSYNQSKVQESSTATKIQGTSAGSPTPLADNSTTQKPAPTSPQDHYAGFPTPQVSQSSTQKPVAVIKPTSQAPSIVQPPPDEGTQRVLEAAQAEWDKVTTIQAGYKETDTSVQGAEPTVVQTVEAMSPRELLQIFQQTDFCNVKSSIHPSIERHGFAVFVNFLFGPPKLHRNLIEERDRVFCIAASQLSNENSSHIRTLQTIYRCLTGSKFDCPRTGNHWEEIGFQGSDPATDLRGAGLLGLMNLLHLLKDPKKYQLASDIYRLSLHPTQNFPFCVMGINLSRIALQTLREGLLNKECNGRHDVIGVVNDFYVGLYLQLYKVWKSQGKTINDSGYVIKDLETRAKKSPRDIFRGLDEYLNKKTVVIKEKSTEPGGDNFINVCDDTT